ncbi:MAG: S-adenosyl-l-methionine hydroxide adenosyltransferase family protein [Candidatus Geothermarchaeales archaeon]
MIAILSDFGLRDYYVGALKGVIQMINPAASVIDISHSVSKWNVEEGAFLLLQSTNWFPDHTIFVAVVDPGVGSERDIIAIKTRNHFLVGPDNGILIPAAKKGGIEEVVTIRNPKYTLERAGTFDGRDVMAPVAAHLSRGVRLSELGPEAQHFVDLEFEIPTFRRDEVQAKVLHIDDFGNAITNMGIESFRRWRGRVKTFSIGIEGQSATLTYCKYYEEMGRQPSLMDGSSGYVEISLLRGNAASELKLKTGHAVIIESWTPTGQSPPRNRGRS